MDSSNDEKLRQLLNLLEIIEKSELPNDSSVDLTSSKIVVKYLSNIVKISTLCSQLLASKNDYSDVATRILRIKGYMCDSNMLETEKGYITFA